MPSHAADLARRLARNAEAVCRHYLSNGHREGRYWLVGDIANTPGRSLFVRLSGPDHGKGAAGKWTDAATGEHGDLLDLIALNRGLDRLHDTLDEARTFLALPPDQRALRQDRLPAPRGSPQSARRLYAISRPIAGTLAQAYLHSRSITIGPPGDPLRFHPRCYYRPDDNSPTETWPALIAAVTDLADNITGVHRTWLDPSGRDKAPIASPRRAMGHLLGHGVRFGVANDVMAAGEGIETMLSLRMVLPTLPIVAALSANHLAALLLPPTLRRLYVARDRDPAGDTAVATLDARAEALGIETFALSPCSDDFNDDLFRLGVDGLWASLFPQLASQDIARFMPSAMAGEGA
jgi:Toprim domain